MAAPNRPTVTGVELNDVTLSMTVAGTADVFRVELQEDSVVMAYAETESAGSLSVVLPERGHEYVELGSGTLKKLIKEEFKTLYDDHVHEYTNYPGGGPAVATKSTKPIDPSIPVPIAVTPLTGTPKGITDVEMTDETRAS